MRIAIGAVAGTIGGPATYAVELTRALVERFPADEFVVLTDRVDAFRAVVDTVEVPLRSAWWQPVWDHFGVARALARGNFDLYHGTKGVLPRRGRTPAVVTVHDLADRVLPATFSPAQRLHLAFETPAALGRASAVITVSEHSARDIRKYFPKATLPIHVVPHGVSTWARRASSDEIQAWRKRYRIEGPCVGYLGTIQPRKNPELLVEAFLRAVEDRDWTLLIAGRERPGYQPACLHGDDRRVRYLGALPEEELAVFLGVLDCMVSPSSYEGFGLTYLESMACGTPVVGVDTSSVGEVVGDAGILVAEADADLVAEQIARLMGDEALRERLGKAGLDRAAGFSWARAAECTRAVYAEAVSGEKR